MKTLVRNFIASLFQRQVVRLIKRNNLKVVAVAGSVGKTTTKMAIATVLSEKYRVLVHDGNYNSQLGLPLSVFELDVPPNLLDMIAWAKLYFATRKIVAQPYAYDVLVLELGTDHPGEIADFYYLRPNIGVITAIAPEHMENFDDLDAVADEEFSLAAFTQTLVLNEAFDQLKVRAAGLNNVIWYSGQAGSYPEAKKYSSHIRQSLSAAVVVAKQLDLSNVQIAQGMANFEPVAGRMVHLDGINGSLLIDDTYNSSPVAVKAALETLNEIPGGRKIAVLGQMNELGQNSPAYHAEMGTYCKELDMLITLSGDANKHLAPAAIKAGLDAAKVKTFDSPYEAGHWLQGQIKPGDTVLIKGSQNGVFAEEVTKLLLADSADAKRLVRQSPSWLKKKAAQFGVQ